MTGTDGLKVVRGLFTCPGCKGIVHREAFRTGGTGYDQRGRYWHHDCYRARKQEDIRKEIRKQKVSFEAWHNFKMSDEDYQWYLDRVQKVFVIVPGEEV